MVTHLQSKLGRLNVNRSTMPLNVRFRSSPFIARGLSRSDDAGMLGRKGKNLHVEDKNWILQCGERGTWKNYSEIQTLFIT